MGDCSDSIGGNPGGLYLWFLINSAINTSSDPRNRLNSYYITNSVEIERPVKTVFVYIQEQIPFIYRELTDMHDTFEIINADKLIGGAEIECIEGDVDSIVHNHYKDV